MNHRLKAIFSVFFLLTGFAGPVLAQPSNEQCSAATGLSIPSVTAGSTVGASADPDLQLPPINGFCGTSITPGGSGVWYTVTGTGNTMTASTCNNGGNASASYDSKISVFCDDCDALQCVAGNDDGPGCAGFSTLAVWPSQAGAQYKIYVHGFAGDSGTFDLEVTDDGQPVQAQPICETPEVDGGDTTRADFVVYKDFDDGNPASVNITISCNMGTPINKTTTINEEDGSVTFTVKDFDDSQMRCTITEEVPMGYTAHYDGSVIQGQAVLESETCIFREVSDGAELRCDIENRIDEVIVDVTKMWIDPKLEAFSNSTSAKARWTCSPIAERDGVSMPNRGRDDDDDDDDDDSSGYLRFYGELDEKSFGVYPHYSGTECDVNERTRGAGVETDDSDCQGLELSPGKGAECTIVNTRFYEGIPALDRYGLMLLTLVLLSLGVVGLRRVI